MRAYLYCATLTKEHKLEVDWPFLPKIGERVHFQQIRGRVKDVVWYADRGRAEEEVYIHIEQDS